MKPSPFSTILFSLVPSFAATTDYNCSHPKVLKELNAFSETSTLVRDQAFKHNFTLSGLKRRIYSPSYGNRLVEKSDVVSKSVNEISGLDEHGRYTTEKRGSVEDFLYKLFGLPDRDNTNGERYGNTTVERRNNNVKVSSTMRKMIESGESNRNNFARQQENRFLPSHIVPLNLALEQLERREPVETATKMHTDDHEKREPTVRAFPYYPERKQPDVKPNPLGSLSPNEAVGHGPRISTSGEPFRRRVLTTLRPIPEPRRSTKSFDTSGI